MTLIDKIENMVNQFYQSTNRDAEGTLQDIAVEIAGYRNGKSSAPDAAGATGGARAETDGPDADSLIRVIFTLLSTDLSAGHAIPPTYRGWMATAARYIANKSHTSTAKFIPAMVEDSEISFHKDALTFIYTVAGLAIEAYGSHPNSEQDLPFVRRELTHADGIKIQKWLSGIYATQSSSLATAAYTVELLEALKHGCLSCGYVGPIPQPEQDGGAA